MKWGYLIPRLLVVLLMWGFVQFGFDPSLRLAGEFGVSAASARQTRLGRVETQFWPPRLEVAKLEVAEDDRLDQAELTAKSIRVEMDEDAFRDRRWIAREMVIEGVEWDVPAEFDEVAETAEDAETSEWLNSIERKGREVLDVQLASLKERVEERLNPDRLETVRLAKVKRERYELTIESLKIQIEELKNQAEQYKEIAENSQVRRAILLDPVRLEAMTRDATTLRQRIDRLRDDLASVKNQLPVDYEELNAARQRDLDSLKTEWSDLKEQPSELAELLLGGPVTDALKQVAVWWPKWKQFHDSGNWDERHDAERRGRTIVFLPKQAGPDAGIRRLLVAGTARSKSGETPFRIEMGDLYYPIAEDNPASFQWVSDGNVALQAAGLVRVHNREPQLMVQFRLRQKENVAKTTEVGSDATVAFKSGPTILQGSLSLGDVVHGDCQFSFADASALVRTGDERYDMFLSALDVDATALTPHMSFTVGEGVSEYDLKCAGLSNLKDTWKNQVANLASEKSAVLKKQAETYLNDQLSGLNLQNEELNELLSGLPEINFNNVADLKVLPQTIRQTAGSKVESKVREARAEVREKVNEKANSFFNKLLR